MMENPTTSMHHLRMSRANTGRPGDVMMEAIRTRMSMSLRRYAMLLKVSPGSLVAYRDGVRPCPRALAERMLTDLGLPLEFWPRGLTY